MKIFVHNLIIMVSLALGSVALADVKTLVITGRVVQLSEQNITVQSGQERVEINFSAVKDAGKYSGNAKVGDTVTVHYEPFTKPGEKHFRADPDYAAIKIEVIAAGGSKK
jgi:hypothetical protein